MEKIPLRSSFQRTISYIISSKCKKKNKGTSSRSPNSLLTSNNTTQPCVSTQARVNNNFVPKNLHQVTPRMPIIKPYRRGTTITDAVAYKRSNKTAKTKNLPPTSSIVPRTNHLPNTPTSQQV
jgi:hypothetical protein